MKDMIRILMIVMLTVAFISCTEKKTGTSNNPIKQQIEKQIGFEFPDFEEINIENGEASFHGDHTNTIVLKFTKKAKLDGFYKEIEERIKTQIEDYRIEDDCVVINDYWSNKDDNYRYSFMSECSKKDDKYFQLEINSRDSIVTLTYGSW